MMVWGLRASLALLLILALALAIQTCRLSDRDAAIARATLEREGWTLPEGKPKIDDAPVRARPVVVVEGGVRYLPVTDRGSGPAGSSSPPQGEFPPPQEASSPGGSRALRCDLQSVSVDINCRSEVVDLDGIHAARLFVWGRLFDPMTGQERILPKTQVGDEKASGVETTKPTVAIDVPNSRREPWTAIRAQLILPESGWAIGISRGRGHVGWCAGYQRTSSENLATVGVEFRF